MRVRVRFDRNQQDATVRTIAGVPALDILIAAQTEELNDPSDGDKDESLGASVPLTVYRVRASSRNIEIDPDGRLLVVASLLAVFVGGCFIISQGRHWGMDALLATWLGASMAIASIALVLCMMVQIVFRRKAPLPEAPNSDGDANHRVRQRNRLEKAIDSDTRELRRLSTVTVLAYVVGFISLITGSIVFVLSGDNTVRAAVGATSGLGTTFTAYLGATLLRDKREVLARLKDHNAEYRKLVGQLAKDGQQIQQAYLAIEEMEPSTLQRLAEMVATLMAQQKPAKAD